MLAEAYRLFRTIEHRLQMVEDQQTHSLPADAAALDNVAQLDGRADGEALLALLAPACRAGRGALRRARSARGSRAPPPIRTGWSQRWPRPDSPMPARRPRASPSGAAVVSGRCALRRHRRRWRRCCRRWSRRSATAPDPSTALNRFDDVVARLPSAINLFRLLEARPSLARLVGDVLSLAPTLADMLGRRPDLIDGLIDASALAPPPSVEALARRFAGTLADEDYQAMLDRVRREVGELRFAEGVQIVSAARDPLDVAGGYARIAEAALDALAQATVAEFEAAHGRIPGGELVILALGRFGGEALTHASDLDIVYLFTGDHLAESDGRQAARRHAVFQPPRPARHRRAVGADRGGAAL